MYLVIGLGNQGLKYKKKRHNAGFQAVDFLVGNLFGKKIKWTLDKKNSSEIIKQKNIIFAKPQTFMNDSGVAVQKLSSLYKIANENIIIIYDELDLPFSTLRVRFGGSSAGHNGIKSIIKHLNNENFWRVRIGILNSKRNVIPADKFVLSKFSNKELKELKEKIFPQVLEKIKEIIL